MAVNGVTHLPHILSIAGVQLVSRFGSILFNFSTHLCLFLSSSNVTGVPVKKPEVKDNKDGTYDVTYMPPPENAPCNVQVQWGGKDVPKR